jgi:membrane-anchored mycosin MYCP
MRSAALAITGVVLVGLPMSGPAIGEMSGLVAEATASGRLPVDVPVLVDIAPGRAPAAGPNRCAASQGVYQGSPSWAQDRIAAPRVWPSTRGDGVTVALISSGIDSGNGQLSGDQVLPGVDLLGSEKGAAGGRLDCDGRGTFEAGLIAALPTPETGFAGVSPGVQLLPVRVMTTTAKPDGSDPQVVGGGPERIAAGINAAVTARARVICVTVATPEDSPQLQDAVSRAVSAGTLIVSAGDRPDDPAGADGEPVPLYPNAYEEVVSVASIGPDGALVPGSPAGADVDLTAPGGGLVSTAPVTTAGTLGHVGPRDDAAAGAAIVASVAALVLAREPSLSPAELTARLRRTAHQGAVGGSEPGPGLVNAYGAVTALPSSARPGTPAGRAFAPRARPGITDDEQSAMWWALLTLAIGAVGAGVGMTIVFGRRRRWRPGGAPNDTVRGVIHRNAEVAGLPRPR